MISKLMKETEFTSYQDDLLFSRVVESDQSETTDSAETKLHPYFLLHHQSENQIAI